MTEWTEARWVADVRRELLENILPFWRRRAVDREHGGFIAEMSNDLRPNPAAGKGLILNARLLWTFSAAFRLTRLPEDRALAQRAFEYLTARFLDPRHGGYFWELNRKGAVLDDKKRIYGQAFCIYALTEYHRTFGAPETLRQAQETFDRIEAHARDDRHGGYFETLTRDWQPSKDMRLSEKDMNEAKSMNNHLHLLEAYTNFYRVGRGDRVAERLRELIALFPRQILNREGTHFQHFFDAEWTPKSDSYTFGHDIEGSWLLCEAAAALGDPALQKEIETLAVRIARAVLDEGLDADGGLLYEARQRKIVNSDKEWWPQAEAVVGFHNAWQISGDDRFREAAARCWEFILRRIVDPVHGEWFWRVSREGTPDDAMPKVSMWKGPYHNARCCLEILCRIDPHAFSVELEKKTSESRRLGLAEK
jgi:mannobiose 2-epimerase